MKKNYKIIFVVVALLVSFLNFSQHKKYDVVIKWPSGLENNKMQLFIDNGIEIKTIVPILSQNEIVVSDNYVSEYVVVSILLDENNYNLPQYSQFYITEKPASIIFNPKLKSSEDFDLMVETIDAYDVNEISKEYNSYTSTLEIERETYLDKNGMDSVYFSIYRKLILRKLDFIKQKKDSYFAFKKFRSEIAPLHFPFRDALLDSFSDFYNATFSEELRNSLEGKEIAKVLESKLVLFKEDIPAPNFVTTDILGNKIRLEDFKGKYLLLNFWATWCEPCIAEIPAIKKISQQYSNDDLSIISVSSDKNFELFSAAIKKNEMNWTNVFRDEKFATIYGASSLPKLYLIDKDGIIIYNRSSQKETDLTNLTLLNEVLKKKINK